MEKTKVEKSKNKTKNLHKQTKGNKLKKTKENNIQVKLDNERIVKELEREASFINSTQMNEKMINQFYKFYKRKIKRKDFYSLLVCGLVLIFIGINFLLEGNNHFFGLIGNIIINVFLIALGIYLWVYALKYQKYDKKESKKIYNDDISKYITNYYFNKEKLLIKNKLGVTERKYELLEAVYETKEYYYILLSETKGFIIKKDSFVKGTEEDFNKFIKEKMGKLYKKRCHRKNKRIK